MPSHLHFDLGIGLTFLLLVHTAYAQFTYISPMPESKMHNKEANIILRSGEYVNAASLRPDLFSISGSVSGEHILKVKLAADKKTILIQHEAVFSGGETVTVTVDDGIRNSDGSSVCGTTFQFQVSDGLNSGDQEAISTATMQMESAELKELKNQVVKNGLELLPSCENPPPFVITSVPGAYYNEPFFFSNHDAPPAALDCWTANIFSSGGDSIYSYYDDNTGFDFKLNDNGYLTYYNKQDDCFDMLDSGYNVIKKMYMGNGYIPNKHEFRIYSDGYRLMQCYDRQEVDMTAYGGQEDAEVTGLVIQQIDPNDDVIFEWRSWDHFEFTDAANDIPLTTNTVDYVHGNSLELDFDGHLLLSSRNMDEITKINISTGDIIWRMGGKNNEFTFIDNPDIPKPFSHQHHFRLLPNGHYTLFDNGNNQNPERSSAKEFILDQVNKTATLVWSYVHPNVNGFNVYASALGNLQILPNGNRLINWGQISPNSPYADIPNFTEVTADGNIVWEFRFLDSTHASYRAHKFPWDRCNLIPDSSLIVDSITTTTAVLHWNNHMKFSGFVLEYKECSASLWMSIPIATNYYHLNGLQPNTCYDWRVQSICVMYEDSFYTEPHQFTTLNPVSTFEPEVKQAHFTLHPNPAIIETEIDFFSVLDCEAEITVYDLRGIMVFHKEMHGQKGINKLNINLQSISAGVYTVRLKLSAGIDYQRLVIQ